MVSLEVQKGILQKALKENVTPFRESNGELLWEGLTRVRSKSTNRVYEIHIKIQVKINRRLHTQIAACLCKPDGIRYEDLVIAAMTDPRLDGCLELKGLPRTEVRHELAKFLKKLGDLKTT